MNTTRLQQIFKRTDGGCHICHKQLLFSDYKLGVWQIEHSKPLSKGGTNHLNNLYPACTTCNLIKATTSSKATRKKFGTRRAPYSLDKKNLIRDKNMATGALVGGCVGLIMGPVGSIFGATIGSLIGNRVSPKK